MHVFNSDCRFVVFFIVPCTCQSLTLWQEITHDMFRLWCLGEEDLLSDTQRYKLTDTGQGMQRVQQSPRTYKAMQVGTIEHERRVLQLYIVFRPLGDPSLVFPPVLEAFSVGPLLYVGNCPVDPPPHDIRLAKYRLQWTVQEILYHAQHSVKNWVGSSVIHLGDHNVPNALMFIDKYTQVRRGSFGRRSYKRSSSGHETEMRSIAFWVQAR